MARGQNKHSGTRQSRQDVERSASVSSGDIQASSNAGPATHSSGDHTDDLTAELERQGPIRQLYFRIPVRMKITDVENFEDAVNDVLYGDDDPVQAALVVAAIGSVGMDLVREVGSNCVEVAGSGAEWSDIPCLELETDQLLIGCEGEADSAHVATLIGLIEQVGGTWEAS